MSDAVDRGFTVTEMAPMDQAINASRETTAAFIGRALRGPLNEPVLVNSFGEFRRRFGDSWSRSSLGPAVQLFFEHGGRELYIVRVANNARGALICLPASGSALVLRALEPGSTERIRAAVDFDGIDNEQLFNLTLQRIDPATGLVCDQELYRKANFLPGEKNFIGDMMLTSTLARVEAPLPTHRPEATSGAELPIDSAYVAAVQEGTDGAELSDYDLVGSRRAETGLFALQQVEQFDLLYLPLPGKGRDLGPASILAAERYCRERSAMLVVDPAIAWDTPESAVDGIRDRGYASPNMIGYFPRMRHRYDDDTPPRPVGGAIAGLLCKLDRTAGAWRHLDQRGLGLNRNLVPATSVDAEDQHQLARAGLNAIVSGPAGSARVVSDVTMGRGSESRREFASLSTRRLCLQVLNAIRHATRWAVFEPLDAHLAERIQNQVMAFLADLVEFGAFANEHIFARCDAGLSNRSDIVGHGVTILVTFTPVGGKEPVSATLHQTIEGCRIASTVFGPVGD